MSTPARRLVRVDVQGDSHTNGRSVVYVGNRTVVVRVDRNHDVPFHCGECGGDTKPCRHVRVAIGARRLLIGGADA